MAIRTVSTPSGVQSAVDDLGSGDEIIVEPGTYKFKREISVTTSGLTIRARNDAVVNNSNLSILDWSDASRSQGIHIYADDVTVRGFEIRNTPKHGITTYVGGAGFKSGDYPARARIIRCNVHHTGGYGVMVPGQDHYLQEVDSHWTGSNDPKTFGDGFQAGDGHGLVFYRCRAWNNRDDGYDLLNGTNMTLIHCYAFNNPGAVPNPNPNGCTGFKLGILDSGTGVGSGGKHYVERCVAYNNTLWGFNSNNSDNASTLINCTAWSNGENNADNFGMATNENAKPVDHVLKNCLNLDGTLLLSPSAIEENNSWNLGLDDSPVQSKNPSDQGFLRPTSDSPVVEAGTSNVDVEYTGAAPDLGAFEAWGIQAEYAGPQKGTLGWHIPLNDNFKSIEYDLRMIARRIRSLGGGDVAIPSLQTPAEGSYNWDVPLNENFVNIGTALAALSAEADAVGAPAPVTTKYETPAKGTLDWHIPLNENFMDISTSVSRLADQIAARE